MGTTIQLKNVRLSFPQLFEARSMAVGDDGKPTKPKFSASFLIDPELPEGEAALGLIRQTLRAVGDEEWPNGIPRSVKPCLHNGNQKDYDGYADMMYVSSSNSLRPVVCDRRRAPITAEDGKIYAGCYVNASVEIWAQDNKWGKRLNASLRGVQLVADGEAFGAKPPDAEDEFEVLDESELTGEGDPFDEGAAGDPFDEGGDGLPF